MTQTEDRDAAPGACAKSKAGAAASGASAKSTPLVKEEPEELGRRAKRMEWIEYYLATLPLSPEVEVEFGGEANADLTDSAISDSKREWEPKSGSWRKRRREVFEAYGWFVTGIIKFVANS